jgi:hypothetical protein
MPKPMTAAVAPERMPVAKMTARKVALSIGGPGWKLLDV